MSIWCSLPPIGFNDDASDESVGQVRSYANGWSNHYPTTDGGVERDASIDLACIPAWCAGGSDDDHESVGPWIRLGICSHTHDIVAPTDVTGEVRAVVVMDEDAAWALVGALTEWLERPKVSPGGDVVVDAAPAVPGDASTARRELHRVLKARYEIGLARLDDPDLADQ